MAITGSPFPDGVACSIGNYDSSLACSGYANLPPPPEVALCAERAGVDSVLCGRGRRAREGL